MGYSVDSHPKIAIVDNDPLTLRTLTGVMPKVIEHSEVIWSAIEGAAAIERCIQPSTMPDILLTDVSLNKMTGIDVCRRIRIRNNSLPVLLLTAFPLERYAQAAQEAGAQGIVGKVDVATLRAAISRLLSGEVWNSSDPLICFESAGVSCARLQRECNESLYQSHEVELSGHEASVLELSSEGLSLTAIAKRLKVSPSTVRTLARRARQKLGATSQSQAVVLWLKQRKRW